MSPPQRTSLTLMLMETQYIQCADASSRVETQKQNAHPTRFHHMDSKTSLSITPKTYRVSSYRSKVIKKPLLHTALNEGMDGGGSCLGGRGLGSSSVICKILTKYKARPHHLTYLTHP